MGRHAVDKKRNFKRSKVKKWAEDLFPKLQEVSLANLTIDELAVLMGKSKSTIYQYFKSKEEIIAYTVLIRLESMAHFANILRKEPFRPAEQYQEFIPILCEGARDISPLFAQQLQLYYPSAWQQVEFFMNGLLDELQQFYTKGIATGFFHPTSTKLLARLDHVFIFQILTDPTILEGQDLELEDLVRAYLTIRLNGLLKPS